MIDGEFFTTSAQIIPTLVIALVIEFRVVFPSAEKESGHLISIAREFGKGGIRFPDVRPYLWDPSWATQFGESAVSYTPYVSEYLRSLNQAERLAAERAIDRVGVAINVTDKQSGYVALPAYVIAGSMLGELVALLAILFTFAPWLSWTAAIFITVVIMAQLLSIAYLAMVTIGQQTVSLEKDLAPALDLLNAAKAHAGMV